MVNFREIGDSEIWELFSRDFLENLGFFIETSPDRGADGGKDILVTETINGKIGNYEYRWLVSCKHNAHSSISVNEALEQNILERVASFRADGFIGMYSTLPSSGLSNRLKQLKESGQLKDYRFFDFKLIENKLVNIGFSSLLMRYFPESYKSIKPLHLVFNHYLPLPCDVCGKDLLEEMFKSRIRGNIVYENVIKGDHCHIENVYVVCQGRCDKKIQKDAFSRDLNTSWSSLDDLVISTLYLKYLLKTIKDIRDGSWIYTDVAFNKERKIFVALAQRNLRYLNQEDRNRIDLLAEYNLM